MRECDCIRKATEGIGTALILYHAHSEDIPGLLRGGACYFFGQKNVTAMGYPMIAAWFVAHTHFPLLQVLRDNPDFDYYWVIEYELRFSGSWRFFFDFFTRIEEDLLTCYIRNYADEPDWVFWPPRHPMKSIPLPERLRSLNTVYRMSKLSLLFLESALRDGWTGHQEVLMSTLLYHGGGTVQDFGGRGGFAPQGMDNRFYASSKGDRRGALTSGTMRFRPCFWGLAFRGTSYIIPSSLWPR